MRIWCWRCHGSDPCPCLSKYLIFVQNRLILEHTAQVSVVVTIPGGIQELDGTQCLVHIDKVVISHRLDLMMLEAFSNLNDSIIL